jgi:UDP-N-acetylmuramoyl-tripeptide--D-alanyl-D-alanine ligase
MRTLPRNIVAGLLALLSRAIVRKYHPKIVMVTGSVGKTSTKDAVAAALSESFHVRKSEKSFNSDFGVPLTIIGARNPWSNIPAWFAVITEALALIFLPNHYPNMLVLEVGADRPGDLAKILTIAKPDAVVVTLLPNVPVHVEAYETPAAVREEEFAPAFALPPHSPLIISVDDDYAASLAKKLDVHVNTFGTREHATVQIQDIDVWMENDFPRGMQANFILQQSGEKVVHEMKVAGAFGRSQLYAPAAALAAAVSLGVSIQHALKGLESYVPPPGRGRIFRGRKNTILLDDSYNSSPAAVEEALRSLELMPRYMHGSAPTRRVAILGDMLELGRYSMAEHARIGHSAHTAVDILITVGSRAKTIGEAAIADGMPVGTVTAFGNAQDAAAGIEELLVEGDSVLIKGSQSIRLERVVKALLADHNDVSELVRQEKEWSKR